MDDNNEPEYNFDGFRIEFNEKIVLIPLETGEDPGLGLPGQESPKK
jgi:hypothetical protein